MPTGGLLPFPRTGCALCAKEILLSLLWALRRAPVGAQRAPPARRLIPYSTQRALDAQSLDRCTVMQHLKVLEDAGLIVVRRRGRERWNHLDALPIQSLHERWIGSYAAYAAQGLLKLKRGLETDLT